MMQPIRLKLPRPDSQVLPLFIPSPSDSHLCLPLDADHAAVSTFGKVHGMAIDSVPSPLDGALLGLALSCPLFQREQ